jgi:uncharacterized protein (DUF2141 family)
MVAAAATAENRPECRCSVAAAHRRIEPVGPTGLFEKNERLERAASPATSPRKARIMPQRILKTVTLGALVLLLSSANSYAGDILITVEGMKADGPLYAALVSGEEKRWPEEPQLIEIVNGNSLRFADVSAGSYAVQVFQDVNGNRELDQSRRGLPQEPVGFSSNPPLFNGKPSPHKARFEHGSAETRLNIRLHTPKARS